MNEQSGVGELKGIGEKTEKLFQKLGVFTVGRSDSVFSAWV